MISLKWRSVGKDAIKRGLYTLETRPSFQRK